MANDIVRSGLNMKNSDGKAGMGGMFTTFGPTGMIEAAGMKRIGIISPIIRSLIDHVSGESNTCPITTMFTDYVEIMSVAS